MEPTIELVSLDRTVLHRIQICACVYAETNLTETEIQRSRHQQIILFVFVLRLFRFGHFLFMFILDRCVFCSVIFLLLCFSNFLFHRLVFQPQLASLVAIFIIIFFFFSVHHSKGVYFLNANEVK